MPRNQGGAMGKLVESLKGLRESTDVAQQRNVQNRPQELSPTEVSQNTLNALKQQLAGPSAELAKESGAMVQRAGDVWSDFYGKELEYDPQQALSLAAGQHAEMMGAHAEMQQMEQTRQTSLKEVAQLAGTAYKEMLEQKHQQRTLALAREDLEYRKTIAEEEKRRAKVTEKQEGEKIKLSEKQVERDLAWRVEDTVNTNADKAFEEAKAEGLEGTERDVYVHERFIRALRFIEDAGLSKSEQTRIKGLAQNWFGKTDKWAGTTAKDRKGKSTAGTIAKHPEYSAPFAYAGATMGGPAFGLIAGPSMIADLSKKLGIPGINLQKLLEQYAVTKGR